MLAICRTASTQFYLLLKLIVLVLMCIDCSSCHAFPPQTNLLYHMKRSSQMSVADTVSAYCPVVRSRTRGTSNNVSGWLRSLTYILLSTFCLHTINLHSQYFIYELMCQLMFHLATLTSTCTAYMCMLVYIYCATLQIKRNIQQKQIIGKT